jgi:hypothetical protein
MKTNYQMILEVKDYCPQDDMFTSNEEIEMLDKHFNLNGMSHLELHNLRDMVVMFWGSRMREERKTNGASDEFFNLMNAMQSITAVIDSFIYKAV